MTEPTGTPIDLDKLRSIGVLGRRTRDQVREWRTDNGERHKATTDELRATVTQHSRVNAPSADRQDVVIRPPTIRVRAEELAHGQK